MWRPPPLIWGHPRFGPTQQVSPDCFTDNPQRTATHSLRGTWLWGPPELSDLPQTTLSISSWQSQVADLRLQCSPGPHQPRAGSPPREHTLFKRILSPCYLHTKVIYSSMYGVNEVVWLMDTNRYCVFDLQNGFYCNGLQLKYANAR